MHEHVFINDPDYAAAFPNLVWAREKRVNAAIAQFDELARLGIGTIVDVTVPGLGRDIGPVLDVARRIDLDIVLATGFFVEDRLPLALRMRGAGLRLDMPDPLPTLFIREIREGIAGTAARAGIIKISSDKAGLTPDIRRVFRAAARAQAETGAPITTHSDAASKGGLDQQDLLAAEGADLERVIIGHSGDSTDLDYLMRLMDRGCAIGMDRFGFQQYLPNDRRIETIVELVRRGYVDRMVLSHDANVYSDLTPPEYRDEMRETIGYEWDFRMISTAILPALLAAGVSQDDIDQMMVRTPARILCLPG